MTPLPLFSSYKQRFVTFFILFFIFLFNLFLEFSYYKKVIQEEVYQTDAVIQNIYNKKGYDVLKLQNTHFTFFTSVSKDTGYKKLQKVNIYLLTTKITFTQYLKGFYTHSFRITPYPKQENIKNSFYNFINTQHQDQSIASLYSALFLAVNTDQSIRDITALYGISHLIAISGFHLGVMSIVLYFLLHIIYKFIHQRYFPYRNIRFDILTLSTVILFSYLILLDFVPSLLRAFTMLVFGLIMLRSNIKILSFETLFWIVAIILALFPKLLFSLSLWFSVAGVFYIFLFLYYFKNLNKYLQFLLFNFWIYLAMNPVVHHFFPITSYEQLYSPLITIGFTLFYPVSLGLHLIGYGNLFDPFLEQLLTIEVHSFEKLTNLTALLGYILLSLLSIYYKKAFYLLNIFIFGFSLYLYF